MYANPVATAFCEIYYNNVSNTYLIHAVIMAYLISQTQLSDPEHIGGGGGGGGGGEDEVKLRGE